MNIERTCIAIPKRTVYDGRTELPPVDYDPMHHTQLNALDRIDITQALEIIADADYYPLPGGDNEV